MSDWSQQFSNLKLRNIDGILIVIINRPEERNSLDRDTWKELSYAFDNIDQDESIRVVIVTGAGDKSFASGADIKWLNVREYSDVLSNSNQETLNKIENCSKPVIAAINGYALGGGCELAMACDIRIAGKSAKFGQPEVGLGIIPGAGGTQRLIKLVGKGKAKELIFTGDIIDSDEAFNIGLINKVVEDDELLSSCITMANTILKKAPMAIKMAKIAINLSESVDTNTGMTFEKVAQAFLFTTEDRIEGTKAFIEKREPEFKNK